MINLYMDKSLLDERKIIKSIDAVFNADITPNMLDSVDCDIIRAIDSAELIDRVTGLVRTPYGLCSHISLSTGCKTILYARHLIRKESDMILNASECGENAFNLLCEYVDNTDLIIYLGIKGCISSDIKYQFLLNGEKVTDDLWLAMMEG